MAPRLLGRPAGLDVNGENGEELMRASFDKVRASVSFVFFGRDCNLLTYHHTTYLRAARRLQDMDDVSVVTDASEEVAAGQAKGGKGKKKVWGVRNG